jgi:hypothetical protein
MRYGTAQKLPEAIGDGLVPVLGGVLVDHRGARAGVAEPGHEFLEGQARSARGEPSR